jgi:hypothetical protein
MSKIKKYKWILILTPVSFMVQYFLSVSTFSLSILNTFFQLVASGLIGWVFTQYWNKCYNSSRVTWWIRFYLLMIIGSMIMAFFDYMGYGINPEY